MDPANNQDETLENDDLEHLADEDEQSGIEDEQSGDEESGEGEGQAPADSQDADEVDPVQKAINKQHYKYREEERKRLAAEEELKKAQEELARYRPDPNTVEIPPMPDAWDEDYDAKIQAREAAIQKKAQLDYQAQVRQDEEFKQQQEAQLRQQRAMQEKLEKYADRATKQGIKEADLVVAANKVADAGVSPHVADFLLTSEDGPTLTAYLADERNTLELYDLAQMNPIEVGMKLTEIRAKAADFFSKGKRQNAPPPADDVTGEGGLPGKNDRPLIAGASFE